MQTDQCAGSHSLQVAGQFVMCSTHRLLSEILCLQAAPTAASLLVAVAAVPSLPTSSKAAAAQSHRTVLRKSSKYRVLLAYRPIWRPML
jgi:hypothetical protein